MNLLSNLKSSIAALSELAAEKKSLEERRAKAQAEISAASAEKLTDKVEARIGRASNIVAVCDARLTRIEAGGTAEADKVLDAYMAARARWNQICAEKREAARAEFLTANLRFFYNSERLTAECLQGVIPVALGRLARAGWNLMPRPDADPFFILREAENFIGFVERNSKELEIEFD